MGKSLEGRQFYYEINFRSTALRRHYKSREFNGFFYVCISTKLSLPAESRSQVLPNLKVSRSNSFYKTRTAFQTEQLD